LASAALARLPQVVFHQHWHLASPIFDGQNITSLHRFIHLTFTLICIHSFNDDTSTVFSHSFRSSAPRTSRELALLIFDEVRLPALSWPLDILTDTRKVPAHV
jgi:hypothetical protein